MSSQEELSATIALLDWQNIYQDLSWIAQKDGKLYEHAAALFLVSAAIIFPFFWPLGLVLLAASMGLYVYYRFKSQRARAILGRIVNKTAWKNEKQLEIYRFTVEITQDFLVRKSGLSPQPLKQIIKEVRVSKVIYNSFELSNPIFMTFSGFGELTGYHNKTFFPLSKTITNKDGVKTRFSVSIPQKDLSRKANWKRMD